MEEFDCLGSYVGVSLTELSLVWRSLQVMVLLERVNICQTRSPQCLGCGINEHLK